MASLVEQAAYKLPEHGDYSSYLTDAYNGRKAITRGQHKGLPAVAEELGLVKNREITTDKGGTWHTYMATDLAIPNFPEGDTKVNEALMVYERNERFNLLV